MHFLTCRPRWLSSLILAMRPSTLCSQSHITLLLQRSSSMKQLKQVQSLLTKAGFLDYRPFAAKLIALSALAPWGTLDHARSLFDTATIRTGFLFNIMIRAYCASIAPMESVRLYNQMCRDAISADKFTFPFLLKACGRVPAFEEDPGFSPTEKGSEIHGRIIVLGLESDPFIQNSLMFMYSQCGPVDLARRVFDEMDERTAVSWNTMIAAYDRCRDFDSADQLLREMPEKNVSSWNNIITRYVRLGDADAARRVFEEMSVRDAISWNTMIAGYIHVKNYGRALELFEQMRRKGIKPTELTIVSVLGACAETGELKLGGEIHRFLKHENYRIEGFLGNALMDMYAKCGNLKLARRVFSEMGMKHVTSWNSMIVNLAVHGHSEEALELFASMESTPSNTTQPNRVTFLGVLIACAHKGLVKEGQEFFDRMVQVYGIEPDAKHYGCMVDLLSRRGLLQEAYQTIKRMAMRGNSVLWKTLLSACRVYGNVELAKKAFEELVDMKLASDEEYVLMSNIYAEAGRWADVERLRAGYFGRSISKPPGWSQIELN